MTLFYHTVIGRLIVDFALKHPDVRLEITTEDQSVDTAKEAYDLMIKVTYLAR